MRSTAVRSAQIEEVLEIRKIQRRAKSIKMKQQWRSVVQMLSWLRSPEWEQERAGWCNFHAGAFKAASTAGGVAFTGSTGEGLAQAPSGSEPPCYTHEQKALHEEWGEWVECTLEENGFDVEELSLFLESDESLSILRRRVKGRKPRPTSKHVLYALEDTGVAFRSWCAMMEATVAGKAIAPPKMSLISHKHSITRQITDNTVRTDLFFLSLLISLPLSLSRRPRSRSRSLALFLVLSLVGCVT